MQLYSKMYRELTANRYHSVNRESKTISNNKSGRLSIFDK